VWIVGGTVVGALGDSILTYELDTGEQRWEYEFRPHIAVADDGLIFLSGSDGLEGETHAVKLNTGEQVWSHDRAYGALAAADGAVYGGKHRHGLEKICARNGLSQWVISVHDRVRSLNISHGTLYLGCKHQTTLIERPGDLFSVDRDLGTTTWSCESAFDVGTVVTTTNGVFGLVNSAPGGNGSIVAVNPSSGEVRWRFEPDCGVSQVVSTAQSVFALTSNSAVYALSEMRGDVQQRVQIEGKMRFIAAGQNGVVVGTDQDVYGISTEEGHFKQSGGIDTHVYRRDNDRSDSTRDCSRCGAVLSRGDARYCPDCGSRV
jgi:outer membrane protein assembly factor BamB